MELRSAILANEGDQTPKKVIWEDDENVLVIIGFGQGTVATGGNVYQSEPGNKRENSHDNI